MNAEPIIQVSGLHKWFGMLHVLSDITIEVQPREVVCIIGRSGSGKSTLLRCINFLEEPSAGKIMVDKLVVEAGGRKGGTYHRLVHEIRLKTGMVFQEFNLFPHMSVLDNVMERTVTVEENGCSKAVEIGMMNLDRVGLLVKKDEYPNRLSGGQKTKGGDCTRAGYGAKSHALR